MKICVYGAGVIGGIMASAIARAGHEVCLIARGPHLAAVKANGLVVETPRDRVVSKLAASSDPRDFGPQDLVIVATKTPAFGEVARGIAPLLGPRTLVGFAVNGIFWFYGDGFAPGGMTLDLSRLDPDGLLHRAIGAERAMGVVCWGGGEIVEPGRVVASRKGGRFVVGTALPGANDAARDLIKSIAAEDIELVHDDDIRRPMWRKFFGIAGNFATCALTGGTIAEVHGDPGVQSVVLGLTSEASAVARAHGFDDLVFDVEAARKNPSTSPHKPSMLQDLERGRAMEIDSTYLVLRDLARQAGVATPTLDAVAPLIAMRAALATRS